MKTRLTLLTASLFSAMTTFSAPAGITVHLYDYSNGNPMAMQESHRFATGILNQAGIVVEWKNCGIGEPACRVGIEDPSNLSVKVLSETMCRRMKFTTFQMGMSVTSTTGGFARDAYICFDRVADLASAKMAPLAPLLGATIAHEIGHLLLGDNSHFSSGIMKAPWGPKEIRQIQEGRMNFAMNQAEKLRNETERRNVMVRANTSQREFSVN